MSEGKEQLKTFIQAKFHEYDTERYPDYVKDYFGTNDYEKLMEHNRKLIDEMSESDIEDLLTLMKLRKRHKMMNMDKESMVPFDTSGFIFTMNDELVIFNER